MKWSDASNTTYQHFAKTEFEHKGSWEELDLSLLNCLNLLRAQIGYPFIINAGYATSGHSPNSQHYRGKAIDGYFKGLSFKVAIMSVLATLWSKGVLFQVNGLGIYPDWNNPGFHIDIRDGMRVIWIRKANDYIYLPDREFYQQLWKL